MDSNLPLPPRLHWIWVLVLNIVTLGIFGMIWLIVQANWTREVNGKKKALILAIAYCAVLPVEFTVVFVGAMAGLLDRPDTITLIARIAIFILWVATVFTLRDELTNSPIEIPLGGVMTLLFGPIYFQYHLFDYQLDGSSGSGSRAVDGILGISGPGRRITPDSGGL